MPRVGKAQQNFPTNARGRLVASKAPQFELLGADQLDMAEGPEPDDGIPSQEQQDAMAKCITAVVLRETKTLTFPWH